MGQSVGQIGQLAAMVTVLQGADVHAVPPAKLSKPETLLLGLVVGVQHDAHPQGSCRDTTLTPSSCSSKTILNVKNTLIFVAKILNLAP